MRRIFGGLHAGGDDGLWPMEGCEQLLPEGDLGSEVGEMDELTGPAAGVSARGATRPG